MRLKSLFLSLLLLTANTAMAAVDMESLLPSVSCGDGWKLAGKYSFYDKETLSDRINGEAELYFPYGFDRMAAARYESAKLPGVGMDVEIFRMGSLLDAFGMYANYRRKDGNEAGAGAESNLSGSQLYFYQGRYFVHLQVTGSAAADPAILKACADIVSKRVPGNRDKPSQLSALARQEIVRGSERYLTQSILGYDFLNRGMIADAKIDGADLQILVIPGTTAESASASFERYRFEVKDGKIETGGKGDAFLTGIDPLYGRIMLLKRGNCLAGALKFDRDAGIRALLESLCDR